MARRLTGATTVYDPDTGVGTTFLPTDDVPDWAAKLITNEAAWEDGDPAELRGGHPGIVHDTTHAEMTEALEQVSTAKLLDASQRLGLDVPDEMDRPGLISMMVYALLANEPIPAVKELSDRIDELEAELTEAKADAGKSEPDDDVEPNEDEGTQPPPPPPAP